MKAIDTLPLVDETVQALSLLNDARFQLLKGFSLQARYTLGGYWMSFEESRPIVRVGLFDTRWLAHPRQPQ